MANEPNTQLPNPHVLLEGATPSVFLSFASAAIDLVSAGKRLFRGSADEHKIINKSWTRVGAFSFLSFRTAALLVAFLLYIFNPVVAAAFYAFVAAATSMYYIGKLGWSFYKYNQYIKEGKDEVRKAKLWQKVKTNLIGAAVSTAVAIAVIAMLVVPGGGLLPIAVVSVVSAIVGLCLVTYSIYQFYQRHKQRSAFIPDLKEYPTASTRDLEYCKEAENERLRQPTVPKPDQPLPQRHEDDTTWKNYHYRVDYDKAIRKLYSETGAIHFMQTEIAFHKESLNNAVARSRNPNQNGLFHGIEQRQIPKRLAKIKLLEQLYEFLNEIKPIATPTEDDEDKKIRRFPLKAGESFRTAFFDRYLDPNVRKTLEHHKADLFQSFFRKEGHTAALYKGVAQLVEQSIRGQFDRPYELPPVFTPIKYRRARSVPNMHTPLRPDDGERIVQPQTPPSGMRRRSTSTAHRPSPLTRL